jgi:hypothetical protein
MLSNGPAESPTFENCPETVLEVERHLAEKRANRGSAADRYSPLRLASVRLRTDLGTER